jgi:hypothetical protein
VHVVLVSSPGRGFEPHWSHACARELAALLAARGAAVTWLAPVRAGQCVDAPPPRIEHERFALPAAAPMHRVARESRSLPVEQALVRVLRRTGFATVVHVGAGARGSTNVNWLAERLGASSFAVARGAEVVCHRGDLWDRDGRACSVFLDAERCRRCCASSPLRSPRANEFRSRADLLVASLLACTCVFVRDAGDVRLLADFGVPERVLAVAADNADIAARICS